MQVFWVWIQAEKRAARKVNRFCRTQCPTYLDKEAATKVYSSAKKSDMNTTPFITIFDYGKAAEGYWTYDLIVLKL